MSERTDHRKLASARIEQAYHQGQREGLGQGLVIGLMCAGVAYPAWMAAIDWVRTVGIWPVCP